MCIRDSSIPPSDQQAARVMYPAVGDSEALPMLPSIPPAVAPSIPPSDQGARVTYPAAAIVSARVTYPEAKEEAKIEEEKAAALAAIERAKEAALAKYKKRSDALQAKMLQSTQQQLALEAELSIATMKKRHEQKAAESGKLYIISYFGYTVYR